MMAEPLAWLALETQKPAGWPELWEEHRSWLEILPVEDPVVPKPAALWLQPVRSAVGREVQPTTQA
jgi:hypothetical protein